MTDMRERVDVDVILKWDTYGNLIPESIIWKDGVKFTVDKVISVCKSASLKAGGMGYRYTVRLTNEDYHVYGKTTFLFLDQGKTPETWFVEAKKSGNYS